MEAATTIAGGEVVFASAGAWRWIGWTAIDPANDRLRRYPAEIFGPLPGSEETRVG